jgi:tetratricopeptide (TPR) repeat protein
VGDYSDDARFFVVAARATPTSGTALIELGSVAYRAGLFAQALQLSQRAIPLDVYATGRALDNAALMAMASGDRKLAAELADELVSRHPARAAYQLRRAAIALNARDLPRAEQHARRALQLTPGFLQAQNLLQVVERTRAMSRSLDRPVALEQDLDLEAARFPEVIARLERLLSEPGAERATLERGAQAIVLAGQPQQAKALLTAYRSRFGETPQLESALALRLERAAEVQAQLAELSRASN